MNFIREKGEQMELGLLFMGSMVLVFSFCTFIISLIICVAYLIDRSEKQ